jgi:hypothetical protein
MNRLAGSGSADALLRVGLPHDVVVKELMTLLDLTNIEAETVWLDAALRLQGVGVLGYAERASN